MIEENEIRVGLSQYERARVAALTAARGVFASEKEALLALFTTASRPKRSRIRAFLEIYHALDGVLRFPAHLPERLGLAVVEALQAGQGSRVAAALAATEPATRPSSPPSPRPVRSGSLRRDPKQAPNPNPAWDPAPNLRRSGPACGSPPRSGAAR
jgi:ParB family chromosome partitioning protein